MGPRRTRRLSFAPRRHDETRTHAADENSRRGASCRSWSFWRSSHEGPEDCRLHHDDTTKHEHTMPMRTRVGPSWLRGNSGVLGDRGRFHGRGVEWNRQGPEECHLNHDDTTKHEDTLPMRTRVGAVMPFVVVLAFFARRTRRISTTTTRRTRRHSADENSRRAVVASW
jgi:hypothetical protein